MSDSSARALARDIKVLVRGDIADRTAPMIKAPAYEVRFA